MDKKDFFLKTRNVFIVFLLLWFFASPTIDYTFCDDCKNPDSEITLLCNICQSTALVSISHKSLDILQVPFVTIQVTESIFFTEPTFSIDKPPQIS